MKSTVEAMSGIYAQLIGQDVGVLPLVEACNKILDYVLENGFGGGSSNPLTPAQLEKIKKDVIDRIKTQVPMGVLLKDCELVDSKLKYTLSDNSNKELDLATLINKSVKNYVDTHKSELKGDKGQQGDRGLTGNAGADGKSAYELWKEKGNIGTEQDFLNSLKGAKGDIGQQGQKGEKGNTGESAFETWKRIKSKPTANETEFLDSLKGAKGDTGNKGADGVQGQKGNDGIGITNIEKVGDKLKITLSNGQVKEFTLSNGGSGTTGLTAEQVKTLINTFYKPQIDSKLERGSLDKSITADQLKKSIDKNTDKLTQTITDLKLVGDKLKYKENGIEKSIILPSGSGGLTTSQVKQIIDTDYVPTINSKLEKGHYTGNATDLEKNINNKADKIELQNYAKKTDISEFIKGTDADTKYNTKKEFNKLKDVATTELSLEGKNLKFKENGVEKTITLPASSEGSGLNEAQVKAIVDRDYKPSIDNKIDKSEYQAKIAALETTVSSKQDASTALKLTDVKNEIKKVVGTAPETLDTLQEIAQALGNDPNKINTILSQLGLKASQKDLDTFKEKTITELKFNNNKITYKENGISKEIDLSSYVNPSTQAIETIVENKGNTLYEQKDNTIVKDLKFNTRDKKLTYKENNVNKEIKLPDNDLGNGKDILKKITNDVNATSDEINSFKTKFDIGSQENIDGKVNTINESSNVFIDNFKTAMSLTDLDKTFNFKGEASNTLNINEDKFQGFMFCENTKISNNYPTESDYGFLYIYIAKTYIKQEFRSLSGKFYTRQSNDSGLSWSTWVLINKGNEDNLRIKFNSNNSATFLSDNESFWFNPETISGNVAISDFYFGNGNTSNLANIYCNTLNAKNKLIAQGEIISSGDITAFSDIRLKTNIEKIENALDKVCQLSGYTYDMNNKRSTGVIAQEVEKVLPEVVQDREDGYKTVAYGNMIGLLVEAIKELKQEIEVLKNGNKI